jgi:hypothetical protein
MTVRWRPYAFVAMLAAGAGLAACDRDRGSGSAGDNIKSACDLLTTGQVMTVMGTPMYPGSQDTDRTIPGTYCDWRSKDYVGEEQENPEYAIFVDEASTDERRDSFKRRRNAKQPETVRGLGDGAYFYIKGSARVPFLEVLVGNRVMTVGVSGNDLHPVSSDEAKRLERAAAELIVSRLKGGGGSS